MPTTGNIHYDTLIALHERYLHNKRIILNQASEQDETKYIWFELNPSMRSFLQEVLDDPIVTGIKTYILQYPETQQEMNGELIPINPDDVNQLTVGFVTTKDEDGRSVDYPESIERETNKMMVLAPPMNHGELCPKRCP